MVTVVTVVLGNFLLNSLGYYVPFVERLVSPPPLLLMRDGHLLRANKRREFLTRDELMAQLREEGVDDIAMVNTAYLGGLGNISLVTHN